MPHFPETPKKLIPSRLTGSNLPPTPDLSATAFATCLSLGAEFAAQIQGKRNLTSAEIEQAERKYLRGARTLARMAAERMLKLLPGVDEAVADGQLMAIPSRKGILKAMIRLVCNATPAGVLEQVIQKVLTKQQSLPT